MKKLFLIMLSSLFILSSCKPEKENQMEQWKNEIRQTEKAFAEMAQKEGIPKAFLTYAADDAVILRNNHLIKGKEALQTFYSQQPNPTEKVSLTWKPDFVDVSSSGDWDTPTAVISTRSPTHWGIQTHLRAFSIPYGDVNLMVHGALFGIN